MYKLTIDETQCKVQTFTILIRLPSLNDLINACKHNKVIGNNLKKDTEASIAWCIKKEKLKPIVNACKITFQWIETNKKRDLDNIYSGKKYILDALQTCSILQNDTQAKVTDLLDFKPIVKKQGGVIVTIYEEMQIQA